MREYARVGTPPGTIAAADSGPDGTSTTTTVDRQAALVLACRGHEAAPACKPDDATTMQS